MWQLFAAMLEDLKKAEKFIFMEYFIIEEGIFWNSILEILKEKAAQFVSIFLADYEMNRKAPVEEFDRYFHQGISMKNDGYVIPFGDGPGPMYQHRVAKTMILSMLNQSQHYVYIMTPYLIIDSELCRAIENAAMRGIDVRIVTPHIPDKKIVFMMTRSYYKRLMDAGVKIYEFESGFVHAKVYLSDDNVGIVGTINMDYREPCASF
jgi:cardiolipin synthase